MAPHRRRADPHTGTSAGLHPRDRGKPGHLPGQTRLPRTPSACGSSSPEPPPGTASSSSPSAPCAPTVSQPVGIVGLGLLDVTAVVVVPLVALGSWWIPNADLAYLVTGLAVHLTYIPLVAGTMVLLSPRAQQHSATSR